MDWTAARKSAELHLYDLKGGADFLPLWSMPHGDDPSSLFVRRTTP